MDGDGIEDQIDTMPNNPSENFSDVYLGGNTYGTIFNAPGVTLSVTEVPNPAGVRIYATGSGGPAPAVVFCEPLLRPRVSPGDDVTVTCGSATAQVSSGSVIAWFGPLIANLPTGSDLRVVEASPGIFDVTNNGATPVVVGGQVIDAAETVSGIADDDQDGLTDAVETNTGVYVSTEDTGTDPGNPDSDGDGLADGREVVLLATSPFTNDTDADGCRDPSEISTDEKHGGKRDPLNQYDFFDVFGQGQSPVKDKKIDVPNDILPVILAYNHGPLDGAPSGLYSTAKDRGPAVMGASYAWQRTGPDGHVDVPNDILPIILQYNHSCA
jgi:hypothetical protein